MPPVENTCVQSRSTWKKHILWAAILFPENQAPATWSHIPCCAEAAIRSNSCVHLNHATKWPCEGGRTLWSVPPNRVGGSLQLVTLSAAFIGPLSSGLWAVLGTRCRLLCTDAYGPPPHRCKGLLPTQSLSVTLDNFPAATVLAHL